MATSPEYRPSDDEGEGLTLRDYLGFFWRRKWLIGIIIVVATLAAFVSSAPRRRCTRPGPTSSMSSNSTSPIH